MTIKQTYFLLSFLVFVTFQFLYFMVRNSSSLLTPEYIDAFFLTMIFSLLALAFSKDLSFRGNTAAIVGSAAGLIIYFTLRKLLSGTMIDFIIILPIVAAVLLTFLIQTAVSILYTNKSE